MSCCTRTGVFKERLSQSALYAGMRSVPDRRGAGGARRGSTARACSFHTGPEPETDLTEDQMLEQCKMYIAALRIADDFGCDAIGIQYQQGLKDLAPASDLAEGLLNNVDRPPVKAAGNGRRMLYEGRGPAAFQRSGRMRRPRCAGHLSPLAQLGFDPETTLHDVR